MSVIGSIFNLLRFNKKNWKAVVLCLSAATVFWFFNSLNKTYTTILSFPIEFQYDQENFIPVTELPKEVKMNVTGMGWSLLRRSAGVKVPVLLLPLERPTEVKKLVGSTLPVVFSSQLSDLQINFVATDTLHLDIEPIEGRWLKLTTTALEKNLKKGYGLTSNATLSPDSVFVQGPRKMVLALPNPYPLTYEKKNIDENQEGMVSIMFKNEQITAELTQVGISFTVDKLHELKDSVKVEFINIPPRVRPASNVAQIHYTLSLPKSSLHTSYSKENIKAILDFKETKAGKFKIAPTITGIPPFSKIIQVDTVEVSY
jgi:hypothetical protein